MSRRRQLAVVALLGLLAAAGAADPSATGADAGPARSSGHAEPAGDSGHSGHGHSDDSGHAASAAPGARAAGTGGLEPAAAAPDSIFQLGSRWATSDGREIPLSKLGGRVQVLAMVYTHCEHACPRIVADMKRIHHDLGDAGERVGYALVSLDPERDDAGRLAAFAEETKLGKDWTLLRAEDASVRELAAALGIRYRRISETDFVHSNLLSVLDARGVVVHRQVGLGVDSQASVEVIRELLAAEP